MESLGFSFIVPTVGRAESVAQVVAQIETIVTEPHEILLVLDGCDPIVEAGLREAVGERAMMAVQLLRLAHQSGASVARNLAIRAAVHPVCVFLDDDVTISAEWWASMTRHLNGGTQCLTGPVLSLERSLVARARGQRYMARYEGLSTGDPVGFLAGGNSAVRRDYLSAVGGFPETVVGGDNLVLARLAQIGVPCIFVREMAICHKHDRGVVRAFSNAFKAGQVSGNWRGLTLEIRLLAGQVHGVREVAPFGLNWFLMCIKAIGAMVATEKSS